jgi:hypothetical protein
VQVVLRAKVDLPPDAVYEILTAPDNAKVFKGIKVCTHHCCSPLMYFLIDALDMNWIGHLILFFLNGTSA